jgi:shikimate kinase
MLRRSVFLYGPPGCGKTSVGKVLAKRLQLPLIDIDDDWLERKWGTSVSSKLAELGDEAFLKLEDKTLGELTLAHPHVVSLTGSNPLMEKGMEKACAGSDVVFLDVDPATIEVFVLSREKKFFLYIVFSRIVLEE